MLQYYSRMTRPLPPRFRTKVTTFQTLVLNAGFMSTEGAVNLNDPWLPWANSLAGMFASGIPTPAANQPTYLSSLFNPDVYRNLRCYGSSIKVSLLQKNTADAIELLIIPSEINLAGSGNVFDTLAQQPYAKWINTTSAKRNILRGYMNVHTYYGVTRRSLQDDISGQFTMYKTGSSPTGPTKIIYWWVYVQNGDNSETLSNVTLDVSVTYYVELFNLATGLLTED